MKPGFTRWLLILLLLNQRKKIRDKKLLSKIQLGVSQKTITQGHAEAAILDSFMRSLNEIDKAIMTMYLDGLSVADIAEVIGLKANAINVRINRLKNKFENTYVE